MKLRAILLFLSALAIGVSIVGAISGWAHAEQGPPPGGRFQYMCLTKLNPRIWEADVQQKLNELGSQGWRLMESRFADRGPGGYMDNYCFERRY